VKRILRYIAGTLDWGITYERSSNGNVLFGYVDADFAGNPDGRVSVTGFIHYLNGGPISWMSKRQPCVSLSSTEAEYYAGSIAGVEIQYLRRALDMLGFAQPDATVLHEDNMATIYMACGDNALFKRAKHIDTRVWRLREMVKTGILSLCKILTTFQIADVVTKSLPASDFERLRARFMTP